MNALLAWIFIAALMNVTIVALTYRKQNEVLDTMTTNQNKIDRVSEQLIKAGQEITTGIDALKAQIDAGETLDFTQLEEIAQALDDLHDDVEAIEPDPNGNGDGEATDE